MTTISPNNIFNEPQKRGLLLLCIFIFPILFTSIVFILVTTIGDIDLSIIGNETKYAKIVTPTNRSSVNKKFNISGRLTPPLADHSYYLLEYRDNLYWPKFDLGKQATNWTKTLTHQAQNKQYAAYQVVMVNSTLKQTIDNWFKTSRESGKYPGITDLPVESIVANIKVKAL